PMQSVMLPLSSRRYLHRGSRAADSALPLQRLIRPRPQDSAPNQKYEWFARPSVRRTLPRAPTSLGEVYGRASSPAPGVVDAVPQAPSLHPRLSYSASDSPPL